MPEPMTEPTKSKKRSRRRRVRRSGGIRKRRGVRALFARLHHNRSSYAIKRKIAGAKLRATSWEGMEMAGRAALPAREVPAQAVELVNHNRPPPPVFL